MASYIRKPEVAVSILLDWLKKAEERTSIKVNKTESPKPEQFKEIRKMLEGMQDLIPKLKEWEESFMKEINALEKDINEDIVDGKQLDFILRKLKFMDGNAKSFKNNIEAIKIPPMEESGAMALQREPEVQARSKDWLRLKVEEKVLVSSVMANLHASYDVLDLQSKLCLLCFSIFPEFSVIKKRPLINWWIAEGFIKPQKKKTTDQVGKTGGEVGEAKFKELMRLGFIQPGYKTKRPDVNSCKMNPWIRQMLISIAREAEFFDFDLTNTPCNNDPPSNNDYSSFRHGYLVSKGRELSEDWLRLEVEEKVLVSSAMANLQASYDVLDSESKLCLLCFTFFPDNSVIKKRPLIDWWIAGGYIKLQKKKTADDEGSKSKPAKSHEGSSHRSEKKDEEKDSNQSSQHDMNTKSEKETADINQGSDAKAEKKTTDQVGKTGREVGEAKFKELMRLGFIQPVYYTNQLDVNNCEMHPWIRRMLISIAKKAEFFYFDSKNAPRNNDSSSFRHGCLVSGSSVPKREDLLTLFNVNEQYLNLKDDWFSKLKNLVVLQLGRWQTSAARHLEVENNEFLKQLRGQKKLKYLSFHGVSRITELPYLVELINLEILELRACHNLEKLPGDYSLLKKLTHLDLSECYLLEGMPKGLDKLHSLQVLKGFLIGRPWSTDYTFSNLAPLKELRKLSICIGREATAGELDLDRLKDITSLRILSITWEKVASKDEGEQPSTIANPMPISKEPVVSDNGAEQSSKTASSTMEKASEALENKGEQSIRTADSGTTSEIQGGQSSTTAKSTAAKSWERKISFPPGLEKLDLWCLPGWPNHLNPSDLNNLKKLYIRGGELVNFPKLLRGKWNVEILRLKYLKNLKFELEEMKGDFPNLIYLEKVKCQGKDHEWPTADQEISGGGGDKRKQKRKQALIK